MKHLLSYLTISLVFIATSIAQTSFDTEKADAYMSLLDMNDKFMGAVQVQRGDTTLYKNAIGYASIKDSIKNTNNTKFRVGSVSKVFTATMVFQLIEDGKLSLSSKLSEYYPRIKNADSITIKELLNHSSGIANFTNNPAFAYIMFNETSHEELLNFVYSLEPSFAPKERTEYSNTNYLLLSYIIENIDGRSYSESLEQRIIKPLNLSETNYGGVIDTTANQASSFQFVSNWERVNESHMSIPSGAGAIVSTVSDLNTFMQALFTSDKLVNKSSLELMKSQNESFGHGLFKIPFTNHFGYGHGGVIDGFKSELYFFPKNAISIAIASNGTNLTINDVLATMLQLAYNMEIELPNFETFKIQKENLKNYTGTYSTSNFPLKITIRDDGNGGLLGQATGQGSFPLTATSATTFEFMAAAIKIRFNAQENGQYQEFKFSQGNQSFTFARE